MEETGAESEARICENMSSSIMPEIGSAHKRLNELILLWRKLGLCVVAEKYDTFPHPS